MADNDIEYRRLRRGDRGQMSQLLSVFAEAFDDSHSYNDRRPGSVYIDNLMARDDFIALVALKADRVLGGLVAYELQKFEQERSEFYLYDLAVAEKYRRRKIASDLINRLRAIASRRRDSIIFVQADVGDHAATELYSGLGGRAEVLHFDIPVRET